MGNTLTGEYLNTWDNSDVQTWKEKAKNEMKYYYLLFNGSVFHDYTDLTYAQKRAKICFALFGPPQENAENIEDAYKSEQKDEAGKILDKIIEVWREVPKDRLCIGVNFISCKKDELEFRVPVFRLLYKQEGNVFLSRFIDHMYRVYDSWDDWKNNNILPMMKYCYPKYGFYSCSNENRQEFDAERDPVVQFGTTPACDLRARITRIADVVTTVTGVTIGVASLFTIAGFISGPILLTLGGGSAVYGFGRAGQRLYDKATHGESLTDLESVVLFTAMLATPLNFASSIANTRLAAGAAQGRIFSQNTRILVTVLNSTNVGLNGFMFTVSLVQILEKGYNGNLQPLDVLQFSISSLFFFNTLMQPVTAKGVITRAQNERIANVANQMTDVETQNAYRKFVDNNSGDMQKNSQLIRTLNRIDDPNKFFADTKNLDVSLGGRKGKTVLLTDTHGNTMRHDPNRPVVFEQRFMGGIGGTPRIDKVSKLNSCLGVADFEQDQYLKNMTDRQRGRVNKTFGGAARYDKKIVDVAKKLAQDINDPGNRNRSTVKINNPDDFMSLVEIVAAESKTGPGAISKFDDPPFYNTFKSNLDNDLAKAQSISNQMNLKFSDPYKACYHYRKHGSDFVQCKQIDVYLEKLPKSLMQDQNCVKVETVRCTLPDGSLETTTHKTYLLKNDKMGVVIEGEGNRQTISTMFVKPGEWQTYIDNLPARQYTNTAPKIYDATNLLASNLGLDGVRVLLHANEGVCDVTDLPSNSDNNYYQRQIALLLENLAEADF
ncbi:unnamed protein product [Adineta steineri]|uniref:DUF4781 domain-containing protein n=1 Tax=Adineta steineri TaxID=433720 RepID=A0A814U319_9BILA|nr:unnamed protein product [Adineta steineri]